MRVALGTDLRSYFHQQAALGKAYTGRASQAASVTQNSAVSLSNPGGSGKNILILAMLCDVSLAGAVGYSAQPAPLGSILTQGVAVGPSTPAPVGVLSAQNNVSAVLAQTPQTSIPLGQDVNLLPLTGWLYGGGGAIVIATVSNNSALAVTFWWVET